MRVILLKSNQFYRLQKQPNIHTNNKNEKISKQ